MQLPKLLKSLSGAVSTTLFIFLVSALSLFAVAVNSGLGKEVSEKPTVVATTSLIASVLQEIGGDEISVVTLIPSGMCPGHFDIKPAEAKVLEKAGLLIQHGYEGESFLKNMLRLAGNPQLSVVTISIEGNWMVPDVYVVAVDRVADALCEAMFGKEKAGSGSAELVKSRAESYKRRIANLSAEVREGARQLRVGEIKVVCSDMQAEFLDWLGFDIVSTYTRPEELSGKKLRSLVEEAKASGAKLVVDNLQSGPDAGSSVASQINVPHVVLTNFPGEYDGKLSYEKTLRDNVSVLFRAAEK